MSKTNPSSQELYAESFFSCLCFSVSCVGLPRSWVPVTGFSATLTFVYNMQSKEAQSPTLSFHSKPLTLLGAKDDFCIYITPQYLIHSRVEVLKKTEYLPATSVPLRCQFPNL